jgi:hypothetical protein
MGQYYESSRAFTEQLADDPGDSSALFHFPGDVKADRILKDMRSSVLGPRREYTKAELEEFHIDAAMAYYGQRVALPAADFQKVTAYVQRWRTPQFEPSDLGQLVFLYGLGIERPINETVWGQRWGYAVFSLKHKLLNLEQWALTQLRTMGVGAVELTGDELQHRSTLADHLAGVLMGATEIHYAAMLCRPGRRFNEAKVRRRHQLQHNLRSWLNREGWPDSESWAKQVYPLRQFVLRAMGGRPKHVRDFEKGLLFPYTNLRLGKAAVCARCGPTGPPHTNCGELHFPLWIIPRDDPNWLETVVIHCARTHTLMEDNGTEHRLPDESCRMKVFTYRGNGKRFPG